MKIFDCFPFFDELLLLDMRLKYLNDSVKKYGRLYTLYTIVKNSVSTELKIRLNAKQWFKE